MIFVLVCVLLALVLGGLVGLLVTRDPGYVLISYAEYVLETSVWVGFLILIGLLVFLWLVGFVTRRVIQSQRGINSFFLSRKARSAREATVRGLLIMAEGRWQEARKLLLGSAQNTQTPLINYLQAARASHELGETERRDEYLLAAQESTPGAKFAVGLTQAQFNLEEGQDDAALTILRELHKRAPKHRAVLAMLAQAHEALGDWQSLEAIRGDLKKQQVLDADGLDALETRLWRARIMDPAYVERSVKALPKALLTDADLILEWVEQLLQQDGDNGVRLAEEVLRMSLNKQFDARLAQRYGEIESPDRKQQIVQVTRWLKARPDDADLLLALGRLQLREQDFDQAREHFEASLAQNASELAYAELGRLCIAMGDKEQGIGYLMQTLTDLPPLPQPAS